jgi:pSer/pThr/pTyr-binding forkhead associated (FHA) protein
MIIIVNNEVKTEYSVRKKRINIGRHRSNDIRIDDALISRLHAQIFRQGRIYYIRDMESKNGTYIDDKRIDIAPLKENTEVRLGNCVLTFVRQQKEIHSVT